jgi:SAM-dependent methyltransferase
MSEPAFTATHAPLGEPSRWVSHWAHLVAPGGAVLDVAAGAGRHARWFAGHGHPVTALDRDAAALAAMQDEPLITVLTADLEGAPWPLPDGAKFAAVVVTNYLHRPLFPHLLEALDTVRPRLRVVAFQDGFLAQPRPAYVQRICAVLEAEPAFDGTQTDRQGDTQGLPPPCYELAG